MYALLQYTVLYTVIIYYSIFPFITAVASNKERRKICTLNTLRLTTQIIYNRLNKLWTHLSFFLNMNEWCRV